jgi:microcystin-dependent protein
MHRAVICFLILFSLCSFSSFAQVPQAFNYQGVLRHEDGSPVKNESVTIRFTIAGGGKEEYIEQHEGVVSSALGLFSLPIGGGRVVKGSFKDIAWGSGQQELKVEFSTASGEQFPPQTVRLLSVPYALYAERAGNSNGGGNFQFEGGTGINVTTKQTSDSTVVTITNTAPGGGTGPGPTYQAGKGIDLKNSTITNTGDTEPADDLTNASQAGGDLSGTFSGLTIKNGVVTGAKIAPKSITLDKLSDQTGAAEGQVLKWKGGKWAMDQDQTGPPPPPEVKYTGDGKSIQVEEATRKIAARNADAIWNANQLQGVAVDMSGMRDDVDYVLKYNRATKRWEPQPDNSAANRVPPGTIVAFGGPKEKIPAGWLLCDGRTVSRTEYKELFDAILISWGLGDGVNTFHLPDLTGRFLRGVAAGNVERDPDWSGRPASNPGGNTGTSPDAVGSIQGDNLKNHTHSYTSANMRADGGTGFEGSGFTSNSNNGNGTAVSSPPLPESGNETRPKNAYVYYIIKAK